MEQTLILKNLHYDSSIKFEIVRGVWYDKKELEYDSTWVIQLKGYYASVGYFNKNWYNYNKDIVTNIYMGKL